MKKSPEAIQKREQRRENAETSFLILTPDFRFLTALRD